MEEKVCTRCGRKQPVDEFYKVKYKDKQPKYQYSVCKTCMSIDQRRRYLMQNDPESPLLDKIEALYEKHRAAGRSVPGSPRRAPSQLEATIDQLLEE